MRKFTSRWAAALLFVPGLAQAAEPACLTRAEFSSLASYALPSVIDGTRNRCKTTLGNSAYLVTDGAKMAQRYAGQKETSWPQAKSAFFKLSAEKGDSSAEMLRKMPDQTLRTVVDTILEGMISQEIPLNHCGTIDEFVRLLSPLPAPNTAGLISLIVSLSAQNEKAKVGGMTICKN